MNIVENPDKLLESIIAEGGAFEDNFLTRHISSLYNPGKVASK